MLPLIFFICKNKRIKNMYQNLHQLMYLYIVQLIELDALINIIIN